MSTGPTSGDVVRNLSQDYNPTTWRSNGRILRNPDRSQTERRVVLQRRILRTMGFLGARGETDRNELSAGASHLVLYHFVINGGAYVQLRDEDSIELKPGDIVIFPHGDPHNMTSNKGTKAPFPSYGISSKIKSRDLSTLQAGGGGVTARFVCGYMTCDPYLSVAITCSNGFYFAE